MYILHCESSLFRLDKKENIETTTYGKVSYLPIYIFVPFRLRNPTGSGPQTIIVLRKTR